MCGVATKCTIPSNKSSNPLPLSNRARVDVVIYGTFYFLLFTFLRAVGYIAWLGFSFLRQLGCPKHPGPKLPIVR